MAREERRLHVEDQPPRPSPHPAAGPAADPAADQAPAAPPPGRHSARRRITPGQGFALLLIGALVLVGFAAAPGPALALAQKAIFVPFLLLAMLRLLAAVTPRRRIPAPPLADAALPAFTIIAPLYREADVAGELVANLDRLDYPRDRLQALVMLEPDDGETIAAFHAMDLPAFIQVVVAPPGSPKTKPRACNLALERARGELLVIYDAEDAPDPGQLREAAARFAAGPASLACLQAPLRIEIPFVSGFLARQFQQEYAAHFEVMLPALARWGLAFPLGGTSNHFRVAPLRAVGGWDPFNVTEDADVGFRLAAAGWTLGVIDRPTMETAPARWKAWRPQRARWIKGHLQTLLVHLRGPAARRPRVALALFLTLFLSLTSTQLHAPLYAAAAMLALLDLMADGQLALDGLGLVFFSFAWSASALAAAVGRRRAGGQARWLDLLAMPGAWLAQGWAGCHALWQFAFNPHHWDKTPHAPRAGRPLS